jgi:hypothetical protein
MGDCWRSRPVGAGAEGAEEEVGPSTGSGRAEEGEVGPSTGSGRAEGDEVGPSTGSGRAEGEDASALRLSSGEPSLGKGPRLRSKRMEKGKKRKSVAVPRLSATDRLHAGHNREIQVVRYPNRKLFNRARKQVFLEWFAATAQTVSKHLMSDPEFAGAYDDALRVSRLRLKAKMLETPKPETPLDPVGEIEPPDIDMLIEKGLAVLREMERAVTLGRNRGAPPRIASNAEVEAAVRKRFKIFAARGRGRKGAA